MAINKDVVPRETPPVNHLGPMLTLDPDQLEDRLKRMSPKDKAYLEYLLNQHAVLIKSKGLHT